jgi:hypothetical protein
MREKREGEKERLGWAKRENEGRGKRERFKLSQKRKEIGLLKHEDTNKIYFCLY